MDEKRAGCAEAALREESGPNGWNLTVSDLLSETNGHHFFGGWHIGWAWGADHEGKIFLDLLCEHRMAGMGAARHFDDGTRESLDTPHDMRLVGKTPEEDAELERAHVEHNRAAYAGLRELGLLPPSGENLVSQEVNEFLQSGHDPADG